ncbi:MAG: 50S ribosomal protein L10 [Candidatus Edwardsbacteria bacterium RIFOXYD12_FULL_50_11]|jgi:large subunit ribosomal protein L10|nr:MAG: 50S ribosomal protein L10 [Candidatus Edwardsbacteria bacterium RifOxyC12_full_54_24]OGF06932.1 MAG: 50S ribosomal protein L10 [Candidatus Edwardsbacteria bacterium RifOxyA12_full_54_48]OGF10882.1 MAG: 50S ribosomal protein L10 [Candidatus Edwardsbacteria bacterium GWE2_54_12]OGF14741.1 MAG: 50S ribosomal protein L10 [Candidatus Edwardsbacteria bacterium RIFOXYD12_FULL_50_11]OGJ18549.1 MAG: 50S ribosomal protein L10 [Candidatus Edwardsbacteria bacterium RifOxyB12_full_52_30]HAD83058.1 
MIKQEKEKIVQELTEKMKTAKAIYLTDFTGLDVVRATELRKKLRDASVEYQVVKNTLAQLAAKNAGMEMLLDYLTGPTGLAFGVKDPIIPAKILVEFAKDDDKPSVKMGVVEGKVVDVKQVKQLALLPSREVLISQILSAMQSPITGLVGALGGIIQKFVGTVDAIAKQKEAK